MGYGKKIYDEACRKLENSRRNAEAEAARKTAEFYRLCPDAREIKEQMGANAAKAARAVICGGDVRREMEKLRDRGLALQAEYDAMLARHGFSPADLQPPYACPRCKDTGVVDGMMCDCLKQLQRAMAYESLNMNAPLEKSTFDTFSLEYYKDDPRALHQMENVLQACKNYAARFSPGSPSLLFKGATGLGKTHLSLAIAGQVTEKGFGVLYGSTQTFAVSLERERFDRPDPETPTDTNARLMSCDLLILDDLGTEFPSQYVNAALYHVVNSRMLADKPTIISTNLTMAELESRYTERFASRLAGYYGKLEFLGTDIRIQRRRLARS